MGIIAFLPFVVGTAIIHRLLRTRLGNGNRLELSFYAVSGGIGLMLEWFLVGLSPWNSFGADSSVSTLFQLAMFSFWGIVAFVPRILQDKRLTVADLVKQLKRSLAAGFAIIYLLTLIVGRPAQFITGIVSIMSLFLSLNLFYFKYIRSWKISAPASSSFLNRQRGQSLGDELTIEVVRLNCCWLESLAFSRRFWWARPDLNRGMHLTSFARFSTLCGHS